MVPQEGRGGGTSYISYIGKCHNEGCGFQAV